MLVVLTVYRYRSKLNRICLKLWNRFTPRLLKPGLVFVLNCRVWTYPRFLKYTFQILSEDPQYWTSVQRCISIGWQLGWSLKMEYTRWGVPKLPFKNAEFAQIVVERRITVGLTHSPTWCQTRSPLWEPRLAHKISQESLLPYFLILMPTSPGIPQYAHGDRGVNWLVPGCLIPLQILDPYFSDDVMETMKRRRAYVSAWWRTLSN